MEGDRMVGTRESRLTVQVIQVGQTLHKLQLHNEPSPSLLNILRPIFTWR